MRRADGEPVAYIVGYKEFHGLPCGSLPAVPRARVRRPSFLSSLAIAAIDELSRSKRPIRLLDLGRAAARSRWHARAPAAIPRSMPRTPARRRSQSHAANAFELGLDVEFRLGSWWEPWIGERFDLAFCNPPYVADGDPHLALLQHEPRAALVGGSSGLSRPGRRLSETPRVISCRRTAVVRAWLRSGEAVAGCYRSPGSQALHTHRDLAGLPRCTGGVLESGSTLGLSRRRGRPAPRLRGKVPSPLLKAPNAGRIPHREFRCRRSMNSRW
jgi:release factor glutamine methyltransferase